MYMGNILEYAQWTHQNGCREHNEGHAAVRMIGDGSIQIFLQISNPSQIH